MPRGVAAPISLEPQVRRAPSKTDGFFKIIIIVPFFIEVSLIETQGLIFKRDLFYTGRE